MRTPYRLKKIANTFRHAVYSRRVTPRACPVEFDGSLESTQALFLHLIEDLHRESWDGRRGRFRVSRSFQRSVAGARADELELGARSFMGAAYFLRRHKRDDLRERYLDFVRRGTDPASGQPWALIDSDAVLVENASLVAGFLLNTDLWQGLTGPEQKNFRDHIASCVRRTFYESNWLWFKIFHLLFLENTGGDPQEKEIVELLERIGSFCDGEGWYSDGRQPHEKRYDHYNAWAMHYYGLLFCRLASDRYDSHKRALKERARDFYKSYLSFFSAQGLPIAWGRSLIYRFGMLGFFALYVSEGLAQADDYPAIKRITVSTVRGFLERPILDGGGLMTLGYLGPCAALLEPYSGDGSPYWAFKFFAFFLLDADHPYWKAPLAPKKEPADTLVRSIGVSVRATAGHRVLLNGGMNSRLYTWKYGKFAYSNVFLQTLDPLYPDNSLVFRRGRVTSGRDTIHDFRVTADGTLRTHWTVHGLPGLDVHSTLVPIEGGYFLVNEITCDRRTECRFYGFAIARARTSVSRSPKTLRVSSERGVSEIGAYHKAPGRFYLQAVPGARALEGTDSVLPAYECSLDTGQTRLLFSAQAGSGMEPAPAEAEDKVRAFL